MPLINIEAAVLLVLGFVFAFAGGYLFSKVLALTGFVFFAAVFGVVALTLSAGNAPVALGVGLVAGVLGVILLRTFVKVALVALGLSVGYLLGEHILLLRLATEPRLPMATALVGALLALFGQDLLLKLTTALWGGAFLALGICHFTGIIHLTHALHAPDLQALPPTLTHIALGSAAVGLLFQLKSS